MNVKTGRKIISCQTVSFDQATNTVHLVEQRLLPHRFEIVAARNYRETARAIRDMVVRGAGAIGATAAFGLAQGLSSFQGRTPRKFRQHVRKVFQTLKEARPTAVDPVNAMNAILAAMRPGRTVEARKALALAAAIQFAERNMADCQAIGRHGAPLIREGMRVLTHCNAGALAFVDHGSATAPLYTARQQGRNFFVFCDETRPRCQGSTLTAWELAQHGIPHAIIADNAAGHLMQRGEIDLVIVGSDRVLARTGEVANKIGTYTKAVLAHRHEIPFYVAIPFSTIDWELRSGRQIPIEERDPAEVLGTWGIGTDGRRDYLRIANPRSTARNPGFDVTPPELITGIITPLGILKPRELWSRRATWR